MSAFEPILAATGRALRPLERAGNDAEALGFLLAGIGWDVVPSAEDLEPLAELLPLGSIARAIELGNQAVSGTLSVDEVAELVEIVQAIAAAIDAWAGLTVDDLADLSAALADPALWADLAEVLAEYLLIRLLDLEVPALALALRLTGIIVWEERDAFHRLGRWRMVWEQVGALFSDPVGAVQTAVGWPAPTAARRLLAMLRRGLGGIGLPVSLVPMTAAVSEAIGSEGTGDPTSLSQVEIILARGRAQDGSPLEAGIVAASAATTGEPIGLYIGNLCAGAVSAGATTGIWTVSANGDVNGAATAGAIVRPGSTEAITGLPSGEVSIELTGDPDEPWRVFGTATGTRVEIEGVEVAAGLTFDASGSETWLSLGATGGGVRVVIDLGGADSFLGSFLGGVAPDFSFPAALRLGSTSGVTVSAGSLALDFTIPIGVQLGPVFLDSVDVGLAGSASAFALDLGAAFDLTIGPFTASAAGIGASFAIALGAEGGSGGAFGGIDAALAFKPPEMIGFELDTEAASGGGLVWIDADIGRYSGALSLDILSIGIDAVVVIDTQLPGDPDGWAFFASLSASFPGIPLGFGFTLNGVGGLIALNRTMDAEALAAGLRSGVVDSLLFPDDPLGDSQELIAQIDEYFPLQEGSTVIGPIIELGWGSPTLITAQLGAMIALPDGIIAVLGSIEAVLPTAEAPVLELHMDTLGVIDVPGGTFSVLASLYDSNLLQVIQLSGDMGTFLQVGARPYFVMSVGGYHPGFEPPSLLPASMQDLRRMQASIEIAADLSVTVQAYFAVTSNTVQFGASVSVIATAKVALATYSARGWFTFDVMFTFNPFTLSANMSAGVGIYSGNKELLGVQLALLLEGPKPWYAIGTASFKFFGLKVSFELEVGGQAASVPPPLAHPRADVIAALGLPDSWIEIAPTDALAASVTYVVADPDDTTRWVRPDHQVGVRQGAAPLNRLLQVVGNSVPAPGEELITVTDAGIGTRTDVDWDLADDWFAPAQFERITGPARLTRASYELMTAGVTFGVPEAAVTTDDTLTRSVTTDYEVEDGYTPEDASLLAAARTGGVAYALRTSSLTAVEPAFTVAPTQYTVAQTVDGTEANKVLSDAGVVSGGVDQHAALTARTATVTTEPWRSSKLTVVPVTAVVTTNGVLS